MYDTLSMTALVSLVFLICCALNLKMKEECKNSFGGLYDWCSVHWIGAVHGTAAALKHIPYRCFIQRDVWKWGKRQQVEREGRVAVSVSQ